MFFGFEGTKDDQTHQLQDKNLLKRPFCSEGPNLTKMEWKWIGNISGLDMDWTWIGNGLERDETDLCISLYVLVHLGHVAEEGIAQ